MPMEEIEKLRARVEKDPNSRLFLPLAEEYRKAGMMDEAVSAILHGLERQPGYTSARVALGRLYLEKNMIDEARKEFEMVVSAIPDNLFSHKKLAEIYRERGEIQKAIAEYEKVLLLNPIDDDAKLSMEEIGGRKTEEAEVATPSMDEEAVHAETFEALAGTENETEAEIVAETEEASDEEFEKFRASFSGMEEEIAGDDRVFDIPEESSVENISNAVAEVSETTSDLSVPSVSIEATGSKDKTDLSTADSFISNGNYFKALEMYREVLERDPGNKQILQRIIELKALMKMMGKSGELVIARLEAFLDSLKKGFSK